MEVMGSCLGEIPARRAKLKKSYEELEAQRTFLTTFLVEWKDLEDHFAQLEEELNKREVEVVEKEKVFEAKAKQTEERLSKREANVQAKEKASLARVQEQRDSALAAIAEERKKFHGQKGGAGGGGGAAAKANDTKADTSAAAAKKDDKLTSPSDKAAHGKKGGGGAAAPANSATAEVVKKEANGAASKAKAAEAAAAAAAAAAVAGKTTAVVEGGKEEEGGDDDADKGETEAPETASADANNDKGDSEVNDGEEKKVSAPEVRVRPAIKAFCEANDGEGLRKFIVQNRKDVATLRAELPFALQMAIDPPRLVLDALEGYFIPDPPTGGPQSNRNDNRREGAAVPASRRACILLLECLAQSLADSSSNGPNQSSVPANAQKTAKEVADEWRSRMAENEEGSQLHALDCQAFLQLVATFGIASQFSTDELFNLITLVARRKQSPSMCRSLGLTEKIPELVEKLAKTGKQVEALAFAHEFDILDKVNPSSLLKAYLKEARKQANTMLKNGNHSPQAQNDAIVKELAALRNVVRCINEYKLESSVSSAPYVKHMQELEKAKSDRKRQAVAVKAQAKRPRVATTVTGKSSGGASNYAAMTTVAGYQGGQANELSYTAAVERGRNYTAGINSTGILDRRTGSLRLPAAGGYGLQRSRSPINVGAGAAYVYRAQEAGLAPQDVLYGAAYAGGQGYAAGNSYQFSGGGLPPPPPAYQQTYLH